MRRAWLGAGVAVVAPSAVLADTVYLKESDAPRELFPEATTWEPMALELTPAELARLSKSLGAEVKQRRYRCLALWRGEVAVGWILVFDVQAQTTAISFAVGVAHDETLRDVQVMVYREPRGAEIRDRRFRRQFFGKRLTDALRLGDDVQAVSGATISSRSATYAARKGLALAAIMKSRSAAGGGR